MYWNIQGKQERIGHWKKTQEKKKLLADTPYHISEKKKKTFTTWTLISK